MAQICYIVLNYNGSGETEKLVRSILDGGDKLDYKIIIADNCSTDCSFEKLETLFSDEDRVDVIKTERNGGYSYGNNYGAKFAIKKYHPEYIVITNPDVEIEQEMVAKLIDTFKYDKRIGMCAPVMKSLDGSYKIYSQRLPTYEDDLRACSLRNKSRTIVEEGYQTLDPEEKMIITDMLPGSFFVVRADVFSSIGMFDEGVFLYCEERIIGNKMKKAGLLAITRTDLFYIHAHSVTIKRALSTYRSWKILLQSRLYYQEKYESVSKWRLLFLKIMMKIFLVELYFLSVMRGQKVE